jgi:fructose-bisphosphate aldolase/6-deoxy-5-ketofructose 1-phosphate synthase
VPTDQQDPQSLCWASVQRVAAFKKRTGVNIVGIGLTVYLGSQYEPEMLAAAAQAVYDAHQFGLITILWIYPRGKAIKDERSADIIAGAAGVAVCLGADFVKVNVPAAADDSDGFASAKALRQATMAAGNTRVIFSGGAQRDPKEFLEDVYHQIHTGGSMGVAIGRNIHQKSVDEALKFCNAVAAVVIDDAEIEKALQYLG